MTDANKLQSQFYITIDGTSVSAGFMRDLEQVTIENSLHLPDVATLVLHDPGLRWIDDSSIEPGKPIQIAVKAGKGEHPLFDGEIVEIEPDFKPDTQRLNIRAFDRLHRLNRGQHVRSFQNVTDGDLIQKIAQEVKLQAQVGPTTQVYDYVLQANETNLAFLQRRAAALGYLLFVKGETLHCTPPATDAPPASITWGQTLNEFRPRMTTLGQVNSVTVRGWDPLKKEAIVGQAESANATTVPQVGIGQNGGELARRAFNIEAQHLVTNGPIRSQAVADLLAQAVADQRGGHFVEAEGLGAGNPALVAGAALQISAVGQRFSGTYFVTSSTHIYDPDEGYRTSFAVSGLNPATLLSLLVEPPEPLLASGLVIGVVTDNQDPENLGRVKVSFPWLSAEHASNWARIVTIGGGSTRGIQFLPEVNDEVLVGFEQGDIHFPYVLGGLWNGQDAPPRSNSAVVKSGKVQQRVLLSRTGHQIILDDDESGGGIMIQDKLGNQVVLDTTKKLLQIKSPGSIDLEAKGSISLRAKENIIITGMGVQVDGQSAAVDVKGSLINLN